MVILLEKAAELVILKSPIDDIDLLICIVNLYFPPASIADSYEIVFDYIESMIDLSEH